MSSAVIKVLRNPECLFAILKALSPLEMLVFCQALTLVNISPLWDSRQFYREISEHILGLTFKPKTRSDFFTLFSTLYNLRVDSVPEVFKKRMFMRDSTTRYRLDRKMDYGKAHFDSIFLPSASPGIYSRSFVYAMNRKIVFVSFALENINKILKVQKLDKNVFAFSNSPNGRYLLVLMEDGSLNYFVIEKHAVTFVDTNWHVTMNVFSTHMFLDEDTILQPVGNKLIKRSLRLPQFSRTMCSRSLLLESDLFYDAEGQTEEASLANSRWDKDNNYGFRVFRHASNKAEVHLVHTTPCNYRDHLKHLLTWAVFDNDDGCDPTLHYLSLTHGSIVNFAPSHNIDNTLFVLVLTDKKPEDGDFAFVPMFESTESICCVEPMQDPELFIPKWNLVLYEVNVARRCVDQKLFLPDVYHAWSYETRTRLINFFGDFQFASVFPLVVTPDFFAIPRSTDVFISNHSALPNYSPIFRVGLGYNHDTAVISDDFQYIVSVKFKERSARGDWGFMIYRLRSNQDPSVCPAVHYDFSRLNTMSDNIHCVSFSRRDYFK
jgi:hypothetical protein